MKYKNKLLFKLFISTLSLSAFTFGGGYVILTMMKKKFVDEYHWIEESEMLDLVSVAQSSPGAIAVNGAIVTGYKLAGMSGVITAITATIIPPFFIISVISVFYNVFRDNKLAGQILEGMQAGAGAVIAATAYEMVSGILRGKQPMSIMIMMFSFIAACIFNSNVICIVIICGFIGVFRTYSGPWRKNK